MSLKFLIFLLFLQAVWCEIDNKTAENDPHWRLQRSKRAFPAVGGLFTVLFNVFKFVFDLSATVKRQEHQQRQEQRLIRLQNDVGSLQRDLQAVHSAVNRLELKFADEVSRLGNRIDFRHAITAHTVDINRLKYFISKFASLNQSSVLFKSDLVEWTTDMLNGSFGAKSCAKTLEGINMLMAGNDLSVSLPLFRQFYNTFTIDDSYQSRLWKTEAYADLYLSKQAELYGLWLKALEYANVDHLNEHRQRVKDLCQSRLQNQLEILENIRRLPTYYSLTGNGPPVSGITQLCSTSPLCIANSFAIATKDGKTALPTSTCAINSTSNSNWNSLTTDCNTEGKFDGVPVMFKHWRRFSTEMLTVADPNVQAICQLFLFEEKVQHHIQVRLRATVCEKNSKSNLPQLANLPHLESSQTNLKVIMWPYKVVRPEFPQWDGWVTGVGLMLNEDSSIGIQMRTDYFPPRLPSN